MYKVWSHIFPQILTEYLNYILCVYSVFLLNIIVNHVG